MRARYQPLEEQLLKALSLPLNIDGNNLHPFVTTLQAFRKPARAAANAGECVIDSGGPRQVR
jgi:hypothetical protein